MTLAAEYQAVLPAAEEGHPMIQSTLVVDARDLTDLVDTGTLQFPLGDQQFELHTQPRPTTSETAIRVRPEHLEALREYGEVAFRRPWGRLTVAIAPEAAR